MSDLLDFGSEGASNFSDFGSQDGMSRLCGPPRKTRYETDLLFSVIAPLGIAGRVWAYSGNGIKGIDSIVILFEFVRAMKYGLADRFVFGAAVQTAVFRNR